MKKLSLILCAVLVFGALALTACGSNSDEPAKDSDAATETKTESADESTEQTVAETEADTTAATEAETEAETEAGTEEAKITYTITVKDQNGDPVAGVRVMICEVGQLCLNPIRSDESGVVVYTVPEATYQAKLAALPEGYTGDTENYVDFPAGSTELTITVTKD